nr:FAD:protein FMN transferase [Anaerosacchariphilus polymeriproducens]
MGTVISNRVFGKHVDEVLLAAFQEVERLEGMLSRFISNSEISKMNHLSGIGYQQVSSETYELLSNGVNFSKLSNGCFDITIGPLVDFWRQSKSNRTQPNHYELKSILPLVNFIDIEFDECKKTVALKKAGQSIDIGGIGKGYAADKVIEVFKKYGMESGFTNFGGNVAVMGVKPDNSPWNIGIRHPRKENSIIGVVSVTDKSVVTSGDYQRYFIDNKGNRYHHILNPCTGYPSESGLISVTVLADSSMEADALSTIIFISGLSNVKKYLNVFPGIEVILIDKELNVYISSGIKDCFKTTKNIEVNIL